MFWPPAARSQLSSYAKEVSRRLLANACIFNDTILRQLFQMCCHVATHVCTRICSAVLALTSSPTFACVSGIRYKQQIPVAAFVRAHAYHDGLGGPQS